ncbi:hypothetical protein ACA910_008749 [Epithemia clementina (nom. ined.)]
MFFWLVTWGFTLGDEGRGGSEDGVARLVEGCDSGVGKNDGPVIGGAEESSILVEEVGVTITPTSVLALSDGETGGGAGAASAWKFVAVVVGENLGASVAWSLGVFLTTTSR